MLLCRPTPVSFALSIQQFHCACAVAGRGHAFDVTTPARDHAQPPRMRNRTVKSFK